MMRSPCIRDRAERLAVILLVGYFGVPGPRSVAGEASPPVDFRREIRPILSDACFDCHGPDPKARKADLRLDVADGGIFGDRDGAHVVLPGKPEESELILRIRATEPDEKMPPPGHHRQLKASEVELLARWVAEGAKWQGHWSLVPPERPPLPAVKESSWPRNAIDRFILARLEEERLHPSPDADRDTLIRRVTLDLTGLPPTPDQVEAFRADPAPDAYERLVDRLLRSSHYGERMALDWLDAARYADSNGYQVDRDREMWPWRDWVVDAFNRNMPFDRFTIEQLAGDLLPDPTVAQRIATGLHRNTMLNEEGGIIPEEFLAEYVSDRVETTSTIWLGLTVGCARCHDHKFDPISQKDFYGLYAFFHNVPETGLGNFGGESRRSAPPLLMIPTPEQQRTLDGQASAIAEVEKRLVDLGPQLALEQIAWEKTYASGNEGGWVVLGPSSLRAKGGTTLKERPDRTIVAEGPNPPAETFEIEAATGLRNITALRLEALPDDRLPAHGPGRAANGNFVLTGLRMSTAGVPVKFKSAAADFSQAKFPVSAAIDDKPETGWAVHPEIGKPHTAVFEVETSTDLSEVFPLSIALDFQSPSAQHQLGKFRLSVTDVTETSMLRPLPSPVAQILAVAADKRDEKQKAELEKYFREKVSPATKPLNDRLAGLRNERAELEKQIPTMMVMAELPEPRVTSILERGQYDKKGEKVGPATLSSLPPLPPDAPRNRLGLARWLVDPRNPLTGRVTVNRYWQAYFGSGIVLTAEDFGSQGEAPSHLELLDWLATEFVRTGWDVKAMQRVIVTSATYRQSSRHAPGSKDRDPANRLLARGPRLRLPAETIRDQALAASGLLVDKLGGPSVKPYHPSGLYEQIVYQGGALYTQGKGDDLHRRSLYTYWKRSVPHPAMLTFDAPFRETCVVRRARTSTPLQALNLMNDPTYIEAARMLAQRMIVEGGAHPEERIAYGFRLTVGRPPEPKELEVLTAGYRAMLADFRGDRAAADELLKIGEAPRNASLDPVEHAAYATVASTLLNLDETVTKE